MRIEGLGATVPQMLIQALGRIAPVTPLAREEAAPADGAMLPNSLANPAIGSVQMLIAMSAASPIEERRRKAAQRATRGLDALAALDAAALLGAPDATELASLAAWSHEPREPSEPALDGLLDEIDLRVRVELAKFDREV